MLQSRAVRADRPPSEFDLSTFLFEIIDASNSVNTKRWSAFYDNIPVDPYVSDGCRFKAIGWFRVKHGMANPNLAIDAHLQNINKLSGLSTTESDRFLSTANPSWESVKSGYKYWHLPQYCMQQSKKYNPVHGDLRREYPGISLEISESSEFRGLLDHYAGFFGWDDAIVLVQFQRVDCTVDRKGLPAVEGFHQDGNRHVGMLIVDRNNITEDSGVSQYVMDDNGKKTEEIVFNHALSPGYLVYWNDKRLWHYATDIQVADPLLNGGRGVRDIVILSAKTPPANMPMGPIPERFK